MSMKQFRNAGAENAFTLVEALVSVGLLGIVALIVYYASNSFFLSMGGIQEKTDLERMRFKYRTTLSCTRTIPNPTCGAANDIIDARNIQGQIITNKNGATVESNYRVRLVCLANRTIQFEYIGKKDQSGNWSPLFQAPIICPKLPT